MLHEKVEPVGKMLGDEVVGGGTHGGAEEGAEGPVGGGPKNAGVLGLAQLEKLGVPPGVVGEREVRLVAVGPLTLVADKVNEGLDGECVGVGAGARSDEIVECRQCNIYDCHNFFVCEYVCVLI